MKQPTANKSHRFLAPLSMIPFLSILSIGATVGACGGGSASSVTPPGAPTISGTSSGNGSATISFSAPADDGGAGISTYTVSCSGNPGSVSGSASPLTVTGLTPGDSYTCSVAATNSAGTGAASGTVSVAALSYAVVDTGATKCYDATSVIACPASGSFFGQDAQISGNQPSFKVAADGLTVYDNNSGLTWQRSPDTNGDGTINIQDKMTWSAAQAYPATLNAAKYGGYSDWRLPAIKELYSLINYQGTDLDPSSTDPSNLTPFIDTAYFKFSYGSPSDGERLIDSQYVSSTKYVGSDAATALGTMVFGVNFADGRIKGYGLTMSNASSGATEKTFFVALVRGNPKYAINGFIDNGDQTISDEATGLMWTKTDSASGMNWGDALAWAQLKNAANYLGHNDWRVPNAKELQSIVDYTRSPDSSGSAAINAMFSSSTIINEGGQADYPYYWSSTTKGSVLGINDEGVYLAFGRALGYMNGAYLDVHGAGAQRGDRKVGTGGCGQGPQGDCQRGLNYVRLVR